MAKLYFKFGAMGCSKTAQALITKFNYEERNMKVLLLKPAIDNRDGANTVKSRIGLKNEAVAVGANENVYDKYMNEYSDCNVIIVDECQFLTPVQVDQLSEIVMIKIYPCCASGLARTLPPTFSPAVKGCLKLRSPLPK